MSSHSMVISKDVASISSDYRGRFAPSPTGPLHEGSLLAALASYLEAKSHGGQWLVRIEDVDTQRSIPGMADEILATLDAFGFEWDGPVWYQSQRTQIYQAVLNELILRGDAYACGCTRKEIADSRIAGIDGPIYPGTCRDGLPENKSARAWRLKIGSQGNIVFNDLIQGRQQQYLQQDIGDFVLLRADGNVAYQLAVVVDDEAQGINNIVRGADLMDSTPRQIYLQQSLAYRTPIYAHLPVLAYSNGEKLSKQTRAKPINPDHASMHLLDALTRLGQMPPGTLFSADLVDIWQWARQNWRLARVPGVRAVTI